MQDTVKEIVPAIAHTSGNVSDAEGSAIGDFIGLKPPERKRKAARPTNSRDKPPYDDRGAKSKRMKQRTAAEDVDRCGTSKRTRFCSICREPGHKSTTCPRRGGLPLKERNETKCSICGVGGHRRNTCNKPKVVLYVAGTTNMDMNALTSLI